MFDLRAQRAASRWRCSSCCIVSHDVVTMQGLLCMVRRWTDRSPSGSSWNTFSSEHTEYLYAATVALLSPFRSSFTHSRRPSGIDSITLFFKRVLQLFQQVQFQIPATPSLVCTDSAFNASSSLASPRH
jgi:hypothetical protein